MQNDRKSFTVSVYARREGKVLLVLHRSHGWVPVGGELLKNEAPGQAAVRKLKEELGWELESDYVFAKSPLLLGQEGLYTFEEHDGGSKGWHMNFVFVVEAKTDRSRLTEQDNPIPRWFGLNDFPLNDLVPQGVRAVVVDLTLPHFKEGRANSSTGKRRVLNRLFDVWTRRYPFMRFGQLLVNYAPGVLPNPRLFHVEDEPFIEHLEKQEGFPAHIKPELGEVETYLKETTKLLGLSIEATQELNSKVESLLESLKEKI